MTRKFTYAVLILFLLLTSITFSKWSSYIADIETAHALANTSFKEEDFGLMDACSSPTSYGAKGIKSDSATIYWEDTVNTAWEYIIQFPTDPYPTGAGIPINIKEVTVTQDYSGNALLPDTEYEYYVRAVCGGEYGNWEGPLGFVTLCAPYVVPFTEGFNTTSTSFDCWTIIDNNKDAASSSGDNIWKQEILQPYEGNRVMYFKGDSGRIHDDWLISPAITMTGGIYAISYYYRGSEESEFEVLLSENGVDIDQFTTALLSKKFHKQQTYKKKTVYVQGITADIHLAWHVTSSEPTDIYLDMLTVKEVDCIGFDLDNIELKEIKTDEAIFEWIDNNNEQWEYYVQPRYGGVPSGSGTLANNNNATITRESGGGNLQPNTEYEFWIRSICGQGKYAEWVGPFVFKTLCDVSLNIPFWEGFNMDSTTRDCWFTKSTSYDPRFHWRFGGDVYVPYEGDADMEINIGDDIGGEADEWLISPELNLDSTKIYRLSYHYHVAMRVPMTVEVLASNKGVNSYFDHVVLSKRIHEYIEPSYKMGRVTSFIHGIGGVTNIAWHLTTRGYIKIDDVYIEEIENCPEPLEVTALDIGEDNATVQWTDDFGNKWEYVIQKHGIGEPLGNGIVTNSKSVILTSDFSGAPLEGETKYEVYVRAVCEEGGYSVWSRPYVFKTKCEKVFNLPFQEGFDDINSWADCWTVIDGNGDSYLHMTNCWMFSDDSYEGKGAARFRAGPYDGVVTPQDDWLISPKLQLEKDKKYTLTYKYNKHEMENRREYTSDYEFEVLLSNTGIDPSDFNQVLLPRTKYTASKGWREQVIEISGVEGVVNIAWHVVSSDNFVDLLLDNVLVEEASNCVWLSNIGVGVKDIEKEKVVIFWDDTTGATQWEYYVQEMGGTMPMGGGIATASKENIVSRDKEGVSLKPDTDYEFYVRSSCGNGEYSSWGGPYVFRTLCGGSYKTPFREGFNTDSKYIDCWKVIDANNDADYLSGFNYWTNQGAINNRYEGDKGMCLVNIFSMDRQDDWLISPEIYLEKGQYVLKYYYVGMPDMSGFTFNNEFEVLFSTSGDDIDKFANVLVPNRKYTNTEWQEEVIFIDNVSGAINLAWHATGDGSTFIGVDNILLKEVITCPEPYYIKVTSRSATTVDIEWEQYGDSTEWEIIVVEYGKDETAVPVFTTVEKGVPETKIVGLSQGGMYLVYVRAKCTQSNTYSDWSTPIDIVTELANDICSGASNIPVNKGECIITTGSTTRGASFSGVPKSICNFLGIEEYDIWFEFTATSSSHTISVEEMIDLAIPGYEESIGVMVYDQNCSSIESSLPIPISCIYLRKGSSSLISSLQPGQKYFIRVISNREIYLELCIKELNYLEISQEGDKYTADELVNFVLFKSNCNVVSNVNIQGNRSAAYFNGNNSTFPFEEGIVLATHNSGQVSGPQWGTKSKGTRIKGDEDINSFIDKHFNPNHTTTGGAKFVSSIDFDFVAIKDFVEFEILFASDFYEKSSACRSDAFVVALLTDITTGEQNNIALIPESETPIAVSTIRNSELLGALCKSMNEEYFLNYYDEAILGNSLYAPINYVGMTVPIKIKSTPLIFGRKYNIKFAVVDFEVGHFGLGSGSALFISSTDFNLEDEEELFIDFKKNICAEESFLLETRLNRSDLVNVDIKWYKDGSLIVGANDSELQVDEGGVYEVKIRFLDLDCEISDSVEINQHPPISGLINRPSEVLVCGQSLRDVIINLRNEEEIIFKDVDRSIYTVGYYLDVADAEALENEILNVENYNLGRTPASHTLYIRVDNTETGCHEVFELRIQPQKGETPKSPENVAVCAGYVFPALERNQYYYSASGGGGMEYKAGEVLDIPGEHTIYVLQLNNEEGCYEETSFKVNVTAPVIADVFEDVEIECELYELRPLSEYNRYFTESNGEGMELYPGMEIPLAQTIYVYAESEDGLCVDESSFKVSYNDCPIPRGISPNGDGFNDTFDLSRHGVEGIKIYNRWGTEVYAHGDGYTTQWHGQNKNGKQLPDGTYYYVIIAHGKTRTGWVQINR